MAGDRCHTHNTIIIMNTSEIIRNDGSKIKVHNDIASVSVDDFSVTIMFKDDWDELNDHLYLYDSKGNMVQWLRQILRTDTTITVKNHKYVRVY